MSEPVIPVDSEFRDDISDATPDRPIEVSRPEPVQPTGHARIDEALERLDRLPEEGAITAHPAEFEAIHRVLRESLAGAGRDERE